MALPTEPITLSVEQIDALNQKLSKMRHDVNGMLTLVTLALGTFRLQPQNGEKWLNIMAEQPEKIVANISQFSSDLESVLHITRP